MVVRVGCLRAGLSQDGEGPVCSVVLPMASKKLTTPSFPWLRPYYGADSIAASVDESTSSVTRSRMASEGSPAHVRSGQQAGRATYALILEPHRAQLRKPGPANANFIA